MCLYKGNIKEFRSYINAMLLVFGRNAKVKDVVKTIRG